MSGKPNEPASLKEQKLVKESPNLGSSKKPQKLGTQGDKKSETQGTQDEAGTIKNVKRYGIPRNVNSYSHFLKHEYITEQDIEWVLKLRNSDNSLKEKLSQIPNAPFSFNDRKTISMEKVHSVSDVYLKKGNITNVEHLVRHRIGPTASLGTVIFETGLRTYDQKDQQLLKQEKGWTNVAKKDRNEFPKFLPKLKEELQMRRTFKSTGKMGDLYHSGLDRYLSLPKYSEKFGYKNIATNTHLTQPDSFSSTIHWATNLRSLKEKQSKPKE